MGYKIQRLQQVIKFKVTQVIHRDLSDPRIGLITITYIKLAKDLTNCTIGYSVLGGDSERSKCEHALKDATSYIQQEVAGALKTRRSPQLYFQYDESIEGSARIAGLLREELGTTEVDHDADAQTDQESDDLKD